MVSSQPFCLLNTSLGSFEGCKPYDKRRLILAIFVGLSLFVSSAASCGSPCSSDLYVPQDEKICERKCQPVYGKTYESDLHRAQTAYWIKPIPNAEEYFPDYTDKIHKAIGNVSYTTLIKRELLLNGPVMACFPVFDEFQHYQSGVYNKTSPDSRMLYGHCAKLVGWGIEKSGEEFWQ